MRQPKPRAISGSITWRRRLVRLREVLSLSEEGFHMILAFGIGAIGGLVRLLFEQGGNGFKVALYGHSGDLAEIAQMCAGWQKLMIPGIGGLVAGLILLRGQKWIAREASGNMLEAVAAGNGSLGLRAAVCKSISSIFSINTGASIGQEGAISQLTATLASKWGQGFRWPPYRLRLMVACGAAAGISSAYNAPISGAVFAAHIVLGNFSMPLFAPLLIASVTAAMVARSFFGMAPWYQVPAFEFAALGNLPWFVILGMICGLGGAVFLKSLSRSESLFSRIPVSLPIRLAIGGVVVGGLAIVFPEAWGNGYAAINAILVHPHSPQFLGALLGIKFLAIIIAVGSGAVGGVFTPTLFIGAGLGGVMGATLHELGFATGLPPGAFVLAGMGAMMAATTFSPLLAIILVFEISLNYSLMPPLMVACAVATLVARRYARVSIYTLGLAKRGIPAEEAGELGAAAQKTVGDLMHEPIPPVRENATLGEIGSRFLKASYNFLPVVDSSQRLLGMVALHDLKEHLKDEAGFQLIIAMDVMRPARDVLVPGQNLLTVVPTLLSTELRNIPVVNSRKEGRLIGRIERSEALGLLSEAITRRELGHG